MQTKYNITWVAAIILNYDRQGAIFLKKDNKKLKWLGKKKEKKKKNKPNGLVFYKLLFSPFLLLCTCFFLF